MNPYRLLIIVAIILLTGFVILGSAHSGNYYSQPIREIEQLSTDYYLGPTIDENNKNISNIKHFEYLDGITESASPIGYYIQFDYKENEISSEVTINSFPVARNESIYDKSIVYEYKGYEIILADSYDEERNLCGLESVAVLGDYVCNVNIGLISPDDVNFERYREVTIEFMSELVDDYIINHK